MKLSVATRKGLFMFEHGGAGAQSWRLAAHHFAGEPVTAVLSDAAGAQTLAALKLGHFGVKLHASADGGANWDELTPPVYPAKPEGVEDPHGWSLEQIWVLEGNHPRAPARVWAGTIPGGLFRSDDGGRTWVLVESLWQMPERKQWLGGGYDMPGIHSICVHPNDPDDIVVGVSCGGAWHTRDGGATWQVGQGMRAEFMPTERQLDPLIQDPHRIVQCAARPEVLWTQHHCGIWRSTDRGANWSEVTAAAPSRFGFAVAVHPRNAKCAWFAPAARDSLRIPVDGKLVVTRTEDGGGSLATLHEGLPTSAAYDLVYRHGLAVANDGNTLAMASTSGGLWLSDDGGDHWSEHPVRLPPVYAVRFAVE